MTDRKYWPAKTKKELAPILAKYLRGAAGARGQ
jgi:hypothetical protein